MKRKGKIHQAITLSLKRLFEARIRYCIIAVEEVRCNPPTKIKELKLKYLHSYNMKEVYTSSLNESLGSIYILAGTTFGVNSGSK